MTGLLLLAICRPSQGQAGAAPLAVPSALAFDAAGNLYVAVTGSNRIVKYQVGGLIAVAGTGVEGFSGDGGTATAAELDSPRGIAVDSSGNLYIADTHNHRVRKVAAGTGDISTVAGTGDIGFSGDGGLATAARLDRPVAIVVTSAGDLYVADSGNNRIRRIDASTSVISTIAGNGVAGFSGDGGAAVSAELNSPQGLVLDSAGNLLIADTWNDRVRRVDLATGVISTVAGIGITTGNLQVFGGDGAAANAAGLALPRGVTADAAGNVYVADTGNNRIRVISASGQITTVVGDGLEGSAGDGTAAVGAELDRPGGVGLSPNGLLTLADTGNGRIRQVDGSPASNPDIQTVSGISSSETGTLSLIGPPSNSYGSGTVSVVLTTRSAATGTVTLSVIDSTPARQLGSTPLPKSGTTNFSLGILGVGTYTLRASYGGDATHATATSGTLSVTVVPLAVTATPNPVVVSYGQMIPPITGSLKGVLPQDSGKVSAAFSTSAVVLSPVGTYPINSTLSGSAAPNYQIHVAAANLTIARAPSVISLVASSAAPIVGMPVTLTISTTSQTSGVPTGIVTIMDGSSALGTASLSAGGVANFVINSLTQGSHLLTVSYPGDSNFLAGTSTTTRIVVAPTPDFALSCTGTLSKSVPAGAVATFNFSVTAEGAGLSSPILLSVKGIPAGATADLNPSSLVPGGTNSFVLTVQTPLAQLSPLDRKPFGGLPVWAGAFFPVAGLRIWCRKKRLRRGGDVAMAVFFCITLVQLLTGCGDRVNIISEAQNNAIYTITVTGVATGPGGSAIQHSTNVTLEVL